MEFSTSSIVGVFWSYSVFKLNPRFLFGFCVLSNGSCFLAHQNPSLDFIRSCASDFLSKDLHLLQLVRLAIC
ncbi:hypothetical protein LWI28_021985 [Acer negundo]|uniref:Uncharacterized protein n=1 Tax=Acer negundo TaxID=4023 RepID=A0AAD5P3V2_ACENE|nr:hypothetical protein LWI28_021985 [Acer negundo]